MRPAHLPRLRVQDQAAGEALHLSEDSDQDVSEDDVQFVDEYAGRLGFLKAAQVKEQDRCGSAASSMRLGAKEWLFK